MKNWAMICLGLVCSVLFIGCPGGGSFPGRSLMGEFSTGLPKHLKQKAPISAAWKTTFAGKVMSVNLTEKMAFACTKEVVDERVHGTSHSATTKHLYTLVAVDLKTGKQSWSLKNSYCQTQIDNGKLYTLQSTASKNQQVNVLELQPSTGKVLKSYLFTGVSCGHMDVFGPGKRVYHNIEREALLPCRMEISQGHALLREDNKIRIASLDSQKEVWQFPSQNQKDTTGPIVSYLLDNSSIYVLYATSQNFPNAKFLRDSTDLVLATKEAGEYGYVLQSIDWKRNKQNWVAEKIPHDLYHAKLYNTQGGVILQWLAHSHSNTFYGEKDRFHHFLSYITKGSKSINGYDVLVLLAKNNGEKHWEEGRHFRNDSSWVGFPEMNVHLHQSSLIKVINDSVTGYTFNGSGGISNSWSFNVAELISGTAAFRSSARGLGSAGSGAPPRVQTMQQISIVDDSYVFVQDNNFGASAVLSLRGNGTPLFAHTGKIHFEPQVQKLASDPSKDPGPKPLPGASRTYRPIVTCTNVDGLKRNLSDRTNQYYGTSGEWLRNVYCVKEETEVVAWNMEGGGKAIWKAKLKLPHDHTITMWVQHGQQYLGVVDQFELYSFALPQ